MPLVHTLGYGMGQATAAPEPEPSSTGQAGAPLPANAIAADPSVYREPGFLDGLGLWGEVIRTPGAIPELLRTAFTGFTKQPAMAAGILAPVAAVALILLPALLGGGAAISRRRRGRNPKKSWRKTMKAAKKREAASRARWGTDYGGIASEQVRKYKRYARVAKRARKAGLKKWPSHDPFADTGAIFG
jgi:hypothetical protein